MICLRIKGRMGNQLFQLAFAKYMESVTGDSIVIDWSEVKERHKESGDGWENSFLGSCIEIVSETSTEQVCLATQDKVLEICKYITYHRYLKCLLPLAKFIAQFFGVYICLDNRYFRYTYFGRKYKLIYGYFESERYFSLVEDELKKIYRKKGKTSNSELYRKICASESICVTIRRGDFFTKENAENFNTARKESTSNGGIVYGPIEYSFGSYYHRYLSQLENDIKEYWISTNAVSDADIDAFYSENQNLFSLNGDADVSAIYLSYIPSDLSADNIFLGLEEGVSLEDIQTQYPYVTDWHTYSFTNETEKSDLLSHADIVSQASSMNTGDVSEPFLDGTYPCIIKVTRKEDATVIPLAEVRNRITDYLLNSRISTETELIQNRLVFTETDAFQNTSIE